MGEATPELPFSQAAANNTGPILAQLKILLADAATVLELGAGTGQHAVAFASALPALHWQPSDHPSAVPTLRLRCDSARIKNLAAPLALDFAAGPWPEPWPDALYTANTLHIVSKTLVEALFEACAHRATTGSSLLVYGPFNYGGAYTSESNASFDEWLKARDPLSGIRDQEWVASLAAAAGYGLEQDIAMPANNRLLCWRKC